MTIIENSGIESGQQQPNRGSASTAGSLTLNQFLLTLLIIVLAAGLFGAGYLVGKSMAPAAEYEDRVSFYARIIANDGEVLHVGGIPENDVNHRGEAFLSWTASNAGDEIYDQYGKRLALSDLQTDDLIQVFYTGPVLETYPVQINGVQKIILLDE